MTKRKAPEDKKSAGRKPIYDTVEGPAIMQERSDAYFEQCDKTNRIYTVPEYAFALGFHSRQTLLEYEAKPEFSDTIKRGRFRIEGQRNQLLLTGKNPIGCIFDLKNNFGWQDKQVLEVSDQDAFTSKTPEEQSLLQRQAAEVAELRKKQAALNHTSSTDHKQGTT